MNNGFSISLCYCYVFDFIRWKAESEGQKAGLRVAIPSLARQHDFVLGPPETEIHTRVQKEPLIFLFLLAEAEEVREYAISASQNHKHLLCRGQAAQG